MSERTSSYLYFSAPHEVLGRKTSLVQVFNARSDVLLGEIKWHSDWRQYCFFPKARCIFNKQCLREIADRCEQMTEDHRAGRAK